MKYVVHRLLLALATLLLVSILVFAMVHMIPGDPAQLLLGDIDDPAALARLRELWGLNHPLPVQYLVWLGHVLTGDLGISISQQRPVITVLLSSAFVTATLVIPSVILAALLSIPAGMLAAWKQNTLTDAGVTTLAIIFLSIPSFWLGLLFLLYFGVHLNLLPVVGYVSITDHFWEGLTYLVMPVSSLALIETGVIMRMARSSTIEVLRLEYVTHARAKGLNELQIAFRHVLKNTMAPTWTMLGLTLSALLGGAVVIETVFSLPGLGRLLVDSIFARDYPVIQGCMLFIAVVFIVVNLLVDLSYPLFDPRVRSP